MRVALAWHNVWADGRRLFAAVAGIGFAVLLVFVQVGTIDAIRRTSTLVFDAFDFDIVLVSNEYQYVNRAGQIRRTHLAQVGVVPEVERVAGLDYSLSTWTDPRTWRRCGVMVLGIDLDPALLRDQRLAAGLDGLRTRDRALLDELSSPLIGKVTAGIEGRLSHVPVTVVGAFRMGMRFYSQGAAVVSRETFPRVASHTPGWTTFGLVQLAEGADQDEVLDRLHLILPDEVIPIPRERFLEMERDHYTIEMPLGIVAQIGVLVSLLLAGVVVTQVLSSDFSNRLTEYATLKATGFSTWYVYRVGLRQAAYLALLAYLPSLALSIGIYRVAFELSSLPLRMSLPIGGFVFAATMATSLLSGLAALRVVHRADPADLM